MLERIDHVAIVVEDLDEAIRLYGTAFAVDRVEREPDRGQGFEVAVFEVGESTIELMASTRPDSVIGKYLARRGPGIHHIAFRVADVSAALASCTGKGITAVDAAPRRGTGGSQIAFLHPKSTLGTLVELVEAPEPKERAPFQGAAFAHEEI